LRGGGDKTDMVDFVEIRRRLEDQCCMFRALDDGVQFYSQSLARDAWATTKQLLAWRDELFSAGSGAPVTEGGSRLDALAKLEALPALPLGKSKGEKVQAALNSLRSAEDVEIDQVDVVCEESMPPIWQKLLAQLRGVGVDVRESTKRYGGAGNDLGAVQRAWVQS
jgi:hypothetical protein